MSGLSEREWSDVLATLPEDPETADGWELSLVRRTVERVLSERVTAALNEAAEAIKAAANKCPVHHIPDCSPLLNGCSPPPQQMINRTRAARIVRAAIPTDSAIAGAP